MLAAAASSGHPLPSPSPRPTPHPPACPPHTSVSLSSLPPPPPPAVFSFSYFSRSRVPVTRLQFVSKQRSEETNLPLCGFFFSLFYLFILHSTAKEPHLAQQLDCSDRPSELLFFSCEFHEVPPLRCQKGHIRVALSLKGQVAAPTLRTANS